VAASSYGGDGIAPDEMFVRPKLDPFQIAVERKWAIFNFVSRYLGMHNAKLVKGWDPDTEYLEEFHQFLLDQKVTFTEAEFAGHQDWLKSELKREMYSSALSIDDARRLAIGRIRSGQGHRRAGQSPRPASTTSSA